MSHGTGPTKRDPRPLPRASYQWPSEKQKPPAIPAVGTHLTHDLYCSVLYGGTCDCPTTEEAT